MDGREPIATGNRFPFFRYMRDKVYLDIGRSDFSIKTLAMFVILSYKIY
jgi:hypothetical protein